MRLTYLDAVEAAAELLPQRVDARGHAVGVVERGPLLVEDGQELGQFVVTLLDPLATLVHLGEREDGQNAGGDHVVAVAVLVEGERPQDELRAAVPDELLDEPCVDGAGVLGSRPHHALRQVV